MVDKFKADQITSCWANCVSASHAGWLKSMFPTYSSVYVGS